MGHNDASMSAIEVSSHSLFKTISSTELSGGLRAEGRDILSSLFRFAIISLGVNAISFIACSLPPKDVIDDAKIVRRCLVFALMNKGIVDNQNRLSHDSPYEIETFRLLVPLVIIPAPPLLLSAYVICNGQMTSYEFVAVCKMVLQR